PCTLRRVSKHGVLRATCQASSLVVSYNKLGRHIRGMVQPFSEAALDAERFRADNHGLIIDEVIHAGLYLCGFCSRNAVSSPSLAVHSRCGISSVLRSAGLQAANMAAVCPVGGF